MIRLLINALRIEKDWNVDRMIAEFPARQWKQCTLLDLVKARLIQQAVLSVVHRLRDWSWWWDGENVSGFIEPTNWPANSPDLNHVEYSVWGGAPFSSSSILSNNQWSWSLETNLDQLLGHN